MRLEQRIMRPKTINQLLSRAKAEVRRELSLILAHVLGCEPTFILAHPEFVVSSKQQWNYSWLVIQRARGMPLAYILGKKAFFGRDFIVNKHTLIPRPETELLVEEVLKKIRATSSEKTLLLDIGTGTGCIPITLSAELHDPRVKIIASDFSQKALKIAEQNDTQLKTSVEFFSSNLLTDLPLKKLISQNSPGQIIITANLPYLTKREYHCEWSIRFEPKTALIAEDNGLALYKKLFTQFLISPLRDFPTTFFFEINPNQAKPLQRFILEKYPEATISILPDLANLDRLVIITTEKQAK